MLVLVLKRLSTLQSLEDKPGVSEKPAFSLPFLLRLSKPLLLSPSGYRFRQVLSLLPNAVNTVKRILKQQQQQGSFYLAFFLRIIHLVCLCQKANLSHSLVQYLVRKHLNHKLDRKPVLIPFSFCLFSELTLPDFPLKNACVNIILLIQALNQFP